VITRLYGYTELVAYVRRTIDIVLDEYMMEAPAVLLVGPRASGKTTTAGRRADVVVRLDDPAQRQAIADNPDAVLNALTGTVLIDEWQFAPEVLGAVKRAVDKGAPPGRFLLTGSTRADLTADGWPATGRLLRMPLWTLSQREQVGSVTDVSPVDVLFDGRVEDLRLPADVPDVGGYVDLALAGGFPALVGRQSARFRSDWLAAYVDQSVMRDTGLAGVQRDPQRLRRYWQAIAANSSGAVAHKTLYDTASIDRLTGASYDGVLELLHLTEQVPAWSSNRLSRLARATKRYVVEPALLGALLNIDRRMVLRNADLTGRLIDTFVMAQLRPELTLAACRPRAFHLRDGDGDHEIDLLLEGPGGQVVAIEIKSASAPDAASARHLIWLRDKLGDQFIGGIVLHTGPRPFRIDDRIMAVPICALWG
jgi:uncharacterized protein